MHTGIVQFRSWRKFELFPCSDAWSMS